MNIEWHVQAGNTCEDVQVWRGTDSLNLAPVFTYPGICGDDDSTKTYSYLDSPPTAGVRYYYRMVIITDRSEVKSLLTYPEDVPELFPNPATREVQVIADPAGNISSYVLYNVHGQVVFELSNPETEQVIDLSEVPAGQYFLGYTSKSRTGYIRLKVL